MGMEMRGSSEALTGSEEAIWGVVNQPLNGTDARRKVEDKLEEKKLLKELKEFDFDF